MSNPDTMAIEFFRDYLLLMARSLLGPRMKAKLDASDLVQQTMLDAHRKYADFRGVSDAQMGAWLRQILRNNFLNAMRDFHRDKRDIRRERPIDWRRLAVDSFSRVDQWLATNEPSPSEQYSAREQMLRLPRALNQLSDSQREAIILYHIQGLKLSEVADRMQKTESAIGGLIYRGVRSLKGLMNPTDSRNHD